jgi:hypothetical protein
MIGLTNVVKSENIFYVFFTNTLNLQYLTKHIMKKCEVK